MRSHSPWFCFQAVFQVNRMDLEGIAYAYFLFWEKHIEEMKLFKKAHLMYLLEDNLPDLVMGVSLKTKYKNLSREEWKKLWILADCCIYTR